MQFTSRAGIPVLVGRLTKRTLLDLPAGIVLVSNCMFNARTPFLAVELGTRSSRDALWIRIRDLKLAGTHFWGFRNEAEALKTQILRLTLEEMQDLIEEPSRSPHR